MLGSLVSLTPVSMSLYLGISRSMMAYVDLKTNWFKRTITIHQLADPVELILWLNSRIRDRPIFFMWPIFCSKLNFRENLAHLLLQIVSLCQIIQIILVLHSFLALHLHQWLVCLSMALKNILNVRLDLLKGNCFKWFFSSDTLFPLSLGIFRNYIE